MKFIGLVLKSARRSKRRTALTDDQRRDRGVPVRRRCAPCSTASTPAPAASSSTRIVTIRSTSLIFRCRPATPRRSRARRACRTSPGRTGSAASTRIRRTSSASSPSSPKSYLRMYPEILLTPEERKAFLDDRTGCIVGDGLAKKYGFKVGDKITLQVGIPIYGSQRLRLHHPRHLPGRRRRGRQPVDDVPLEVRRRAIDRRKGRSAGTSTQIANPDQATQVAHGDRPEVRELAVRDQDRHRAGVLRRRSRRCSAT